MKVLGQVLLSLGLLVVFAVAAFELDGLLAASYDPQMAYFFDSLAPFRGRLYAFTDHPGTPVEMIGTFLVALTAPFLAGVGEGLVAYHIAHPRIFFLLGYAFLTLGSIATLALIVRVFSRDPEGEPVPTLLSLALGAVYFVPLPQPAFESLVFWSHNAFAFVGGSSLLVALFVAARSDEGRSRRRLLLVGFLAGCLTAVQLYFAAWVVAVAVVSAALARTRHGSGWDGLREALATGAASIGGFLVATLPILPRYPKFLRWVWALTTHQGRYGWGPSGVISTEGVVDHATALWTAGPSAIGCVLGGVALLLIAMAVRARRSPRGAWWALSLGVLALTGTLAVLLIKHPSRRYLLAVVATLPFVLGLALPVIAGRWRRGRLLLTGVSIVILASFFRGLPDEIGHIRETATFARDSQAAVEVVLDEYAQAVRRARRELTVLWAYGVPSVCFGRRYGASFHEDLYREDVDRLCPNEWNYDGGRSAEVPWFERVRAGTVDWDVLVSRTRSRRVPRPPSRLGRVISLGGAGKGRVLLIFRDRAHAPREPPRGVWPSPRTRESPVDSVRRRRRPRSSVDVEKRGQGGGMRGPSACTETDGKKAPSGASDEPLIPKGTASGGDHDDVVSSRWAMSARPEARDARSTVLTLQRRKDRGERISMLTAYDYPTARLVDAAGVDAILVGDSLAMVVLGHETTLTVTMEEMLHHARAVARGASRALLVGDMPFLSYQADVAEAVRNAGRYLQAGMHAVKIEGGRDYADTASAIVRAGIPVMGHVGLMPQSVRRLGGYRTQGKAAESARVLLDDALALEAAGCFAVVLESVPEQVAAAIAERLDVPTIGIGAGAGTDGQILVTHDMLGLYDHAPRFVRRYARLDEEILRALRSYREDVEAGRFPAVEHSFSMTEEQSGAFLATLGPQPERVRRR